jgi:hypothetical protein
VGALIITVTLVGVGLAVDRFDPSHPRLTHLMYLMDADSGTAMWASDDQRLAPWTAAYVPKANGNPEAPFPLPYGNTPRWLAPAEQLPVSPPRIDFLESRSDGDATLVKAQVTSPRRGQVITLNTNRPVQNTIITADGEPRRQRRRAIPMTPVRVRGRTSCASTTSGGRVRRNAATSRCRTSSDLRQRLHRGPGTDTRVHAGAS